MRNVFEFNPMLASSRAEWFLEPFPHYRVPQALFQPEFRNLSSGAKLIYGVLLSRMALSSQNGWMNDDDYYCYLKVSEIGSMLGCGHDAATGYLRALEDYSLICRVRQGLGKPDRITALPFEPVYGKFAYSDAENRLSCDLLNVKPESENLAGK